MKAHGGVAAGATGVTANWTQTYTYDRYGNKTATSVSGDLEDTTRAPRDGLSLVSVNTATNRVNTSGWEYDLTGNLIRGRDVSNAWQRFEYDAAGRLVKIKNDSNVVLETYTYGASRERLVTENSSFRRYYVWGGSSVVAEYTESTASTTPDYAKSYVYAGSRLLATYAPTSTTKEAKQYHHPDRLGTQLVTTGASTSYRQTTFPFGTTISAETTGNSNQIFTSYDRSTTTGLDYAQNRTYSQGQSRFTQVDPIGMASAMLGNPQSNNLFAYVMNMPTDFVDPSGLNAAGGYYTWTCYYTWASDWDGSNFRITSKTCWNTGYVDSTGGHGSGSSSPSVSASPDEFQYQKCMRAVEKKYKDLKKPDNYGEYSQVRDQLVQSVNKRNAALGSLTPVQVVLLAVSLRGGKVGVAIWAAGTVAAKIWESGVIHEEWMTGVGNLERTFPAGVEYDKQMGYKEAEQDECEKYLKRP